VVIEHSFVTTLDSTQALESSFRFLQSRGFSPSNGDTVRPQVSANRLELRRGKENPARARNVSELPQSIRLDFDRGRVSLAIAITPSTAWGGRSFTNSDIGVQIRDVENPRRLKLHHELLVGIAYGLERLLVERLSAEEAAHDWIDAEENITKAARSRKRKTIAAVSCLLVFVGFIVGLVVYTAH
jgi:hypothetical protein